MTDADKVMYIHNFLRDTRIRTWINLETWIRIPGHFWLRLDALAEVCALWAQSGLLSHPHENKNKPELVAVGPTKN